MENIFCDVKDTEVYIDNIGAFSNTWDHHINLLRIIMTKLQDNGFTVNPLTCDWAVQETNIILGADFLSKSGIDIKYSMGIIERFDNELPVRNLHQLDGKNT